MVTYLHPERFTQRVFVRLGYERGQLEILPCKYLFACRQFVMDDNKRPKYFELSQDAQLRVGKNCCGKHSYSVQCIACEQTPWTGVERKTF